MSYYKIIIYWIYCTLLLTTVNIYGQTTNSQQKLYTKLSHELKCLVCMNQSIAESNSIFAHNVKALIKELIQNKLSETQIKDFMQQRYGEQILLLPEKNVHNVLLWILPVLILSTIFIIFNIVIWNKNRCGLKNIN